MMANLAPSSHSSESDLLSLTMEEVIAAFLATEKNRRRDFPDDDSQKEVTVSIRSVPLGLPEILDCVAYELRTTRSIVTRCLSHRVAAWFDSMSSAAELVELFQQAQLRAVNEGFADILRRFRTASYQMTVPCSEPTSFRSIAWVQSKLYSLSVPVGVPVSSMFAIGLCEAVGATGTGRFRGTLDTLDVEVTRLSAHIGQRYIEVQAIQKLLDYRSDRDKARHGS